MYCTKNKTKQEPAQRGERKVQSSTCWRNKNRGVTSDSARDWREESSEITSSLLGFKVDLSSLPFISLTAAVIRGVDINWIPTQRPSLRLMYRKVIWLLRVKKAFYKYWTRWTFLFNNQPRWWESIWRDFPPRRHSSCPAALHSKRSRWVLTDEGTRSKTAAVAVPQRTSNQRNPWVRHKMFINKLIS